MAEELKQTSVHLPAALYAWLRRESFDRNISQSQLVRELLERERARVTAAT